MSKIAKLALFVVACLAIGAGLGLMGVGRGDWGLSLQLARRGDVVLMLLPFVWVISTLMIGHAVSGRLRAVTISGVSRTRVIVTDELKQLIVAAYIGDGQPSIRDVASKLRCSYGTVHRVLGEAGKLRPRGVTKVARARKAVTA